MSTHKSLLVLASILSLLLAGCGDGNQAENQASNETADTTQTEGDLAPVKQEKGLFDTISTYSDYWNTLYSGNEEVINAYEGMPIMELVTSQLTFVTTVQFDMLNLQNVEGRFEGTLMLAGYDGFVEKAGERITFGYDHVLDKDGYGPSAKAGDRQKMDGFLDLASGYYHAESSSEREGSVLGRSFVEFKKLADGSMICIDYHANAFDFRGNATNEDIVIYLHNGENRYDFIVAKGQNGTSFTPISLADHGDLTKEGAIELLTAAGYTIDKSGGIKDGQLVLD